MARRLKLTRKGVTNVNYQWAGAFRLRVECSDPTDSGADPYVFLYRRNPVNPYSGASQDDFFAVASPVDLAEYPVADPDPAAEFPFFRLDYVELDLRATSLAERVWTTIVNEVSNLLAALDRLEALEVVDEEWVGDPIPAGPTSESDSESSSASS